MTRAPRPLPDSLGETFSVHSARAAGVTPRRLRHASLKSPYRGARIDEKPREKVDADLSAVAKEAKLLAAEIAQHAAAFATVAPPHAFFSHLTAAVLWGLPVPLRLLRRVLHEWREGKSRHPPLGIDVSVFPPHRPSRARAVHGRQLRRSLATVRMRDGLRVASPATTWAQLAQILTVDELIEMGDAIVRIPRTRGMLRGSEADALGTIAQLEAAAHARYRHGAPALRRALTEIRVGSASPAETRIRLGCERAGLPRAELDFDVFDRAGKPIGFTEIAFPDYRLLVEYEGDHHRTDPDQWRRDIEKHTACAEAGWAVLRLTSEHAYPRTDGAVARVRAALIRGGWRP